MIIIKWIAGLAFLWGFFGYAAGTEENWRNRCDARGVVCVNDCEGQQPQAEDDPCWLITSPDSDYEVPFWMIGVKDYRQ